MTCSLAGLISYEFEMSFCFAECSVTSCFDSHSKLHAGSAPIMLTVFFYEPLICVVSDTADKRNLCSVFNHIQTGRRGERGWSEEEWRESRQVERRSREWTSGERMERVDEWRGG